MDLENIVRLQMQSYVKFAIQYNCSSSDSSKNRPLPPLRYDENRHVATDCIDKISQEENIVGDQMSNLTKNADILFTMQFINQA